MAEHSIRQGPWACRLYLVQGSGPHTSAVADLFLLVTGIHAAGHHDLFALAHNLGIGQLGHSMQGSARLCRNGDRRIVHLNKVQLSD